MVVIIEFIVVVLYQTLMSVLLKMVAVMRPVSIPMVVTFVNAVVDYSYYLT